jgi:hypothetical protein
MTVLLSGCASVGPPVPPSLKIPEAVRDLSVFERGDNLIVDFTAPARATDGLALQRLDRIDLEIDSKGVPVSRTEPGPVHLTLAVREWAGRNITVRVRSAGPSGRYSAWSNQAHLKALPPLPQPQVHAEAAPSGVRLTWPAAGAGAQYRVYRLGPGELKPALAATVTAPEYVDSQAQFGKTYEYSLQAFVPSGDSEVQSEPSAAVSIAPVDTFPPAVPAGLTALAGVSSIDVTWNPDSEPDLKGYYLYRSAGGQPFARLGELLTAPAATDRAVQSGVHYRYEVSAVDQAGNESAHSAPVEAIAP